MRSLIQILVCLSLIGCKTSNPSLFNASSDIFKDRYIEFIAKDEIQVASWYNYVKTKTKNNNYVLRTFYPETKQITSKVYYKDKSTKIANGEAIYWHENGNMKSVGVYSNSKSIGPWKYYHRKTGKLSSEGNFESGKKHGNWKIYDQEGRLKEQLNYEYDIKEGKFIQYDSLQVITNEGIYRSDTIFQQSKIDTTDSSIELMPYLSQCKGIENIDQRSKCSIDALLEYIYTSIKYPENARILGLEGMTTTQFVIDKDGSVTDIDVVIGLCQEFKDLNIEIISNMPDWEPGTQGGKKVRILYTLPIFYRLE